MQRYATIKLCCLHVLFGSHGYALLTLQSMISVSLYDLHFVFPLYVAKVNDWKLTERKTNKQTAWWTGATTTKMATHHISSAESGWAHWPSWGLYDNSSSSKGDLWGCRRGSIPGGSTPKVRTMQGFNRLIVLSWEFEQFIHFRSGIEGLEWDSSWVRYTATCGELIPRYHLRPSKAHTPFPPRHFQLFIALGGIPHQVRQSEQFPLWLGGAEKIRSLCIMSKKCIKVYDVHIHILLPV